MELEEVNHTNTKMPSKHEEFEACQLCSKKSLDEWINEIELKEREDSASSENTDSFRECVTLPLIFLAAIFYGAITRIPIVFVVHYAINDLQMSFVLASTCYASYSVGRIFGSYVAGRCYHIFTLIFVNALAFVGILCASIFSKNGIWLVYVLSLVFLGLAETAPALDIMVLDALRHEPLARLERWMRSLLVYESLGSVISFTVGAWMYENYSFEYMWILFAILITIELVLLICISYLPSQRLYDWGEDDFDGPSPSVDNNEFQAVNASYFFVGFAFATSPMAIATHFTILVPYFDEEFENNSQVTGLMMAIGECIGIMLVVYVCTDHFLNSCVFGFFRKHAVPLTLFLLSISLFLQLTPWIYLAYTGTVMVHAFNALSHSVVNQLVATLSQGRSELGNVLASTGYISKRASNTVCTIVYVILYGVDSKLPFIVSGCLSMICAIFMVLYPSSDVNSHLSFFKSVSFNWT